MTIPADPAGARQRRTVRPWMIAAAVALVVAATAGGWFLWDNASVRADAQAAFDAAIDACQAQADGVTRDSVSSAIVEAQSDATLAATLGAADDFLASEPTVADDATLAELTVRLDSTRALAEATPVFETDTCEAIPDPILNAEPVTIELITATPRVEEITESRLALAAALETAEGSWLTAEAAALAEAIAAAAEILTASEGTLDGESLTALTDAIRAAQTILDEGTVGASVTETVAQFRTQVAALSTATGQAADATAVALEATGAEIPSAVAQARSTSERATGTSSSTSQAASSTSQSSSAPSSSATSTGSSSASTSGSGGGGQSSTTPAPPSPSPSPAPSTPAPTPKPSPTPEPAPTPVNEWGGVRYDAATCSPYGGGWADDLASARATASSMAGQYGAYHLSGVSNDITITVYGCLKD